MANRHMKRCSALLSSEICKSKLQFDTEVPYTDQNGHHQKPKNNKSWRGCGEKQSSQTAGGNVNWYNHYGEYMEVH